MDTSLLPSLTEILIRLGASLVIGIIIGLEREIQHKTAGLRTCVLICIGTTIFTISSIEFRVFGSGADPSRIAAQIVTGIGFLGAGTIIQTRGSVHGLTTAATIWVMASLGLAVGLGAYILAIGGAVLTVLALQPMQLMERLVKGKKSTFGYKVVMTDSGPGLDTIMKGIHESPSEVKRIQIQKQEDGRHVATFEYTDRDDAHSKLIEDLTKSGGVDEVTSTKSN